MTAPTSEALRRVEADTRIGTALRTLVPDAASG